jgi:branched-chain amino acid transport system permease protein
MDLVINSRRWIACVVTLAIGACLPFVLGMDEYNLGQMEYIASIVMVACGLNIVLGFAGQVFIGPSALSASGGYLAAILASRYELFQSLPMMCVVSVAVALVVAAVTAIPTLRVSGFYFGMITLFLALAVPIVASHLSITGGSTGISLITVPTFVQDPSGVILYQVGVVLILALSAYSWMILNSRLGRRLTAIRASDELAQAVGVPLYRTKLTALLLGAVPCGLGGAYYVYTQQFISPGSVSPILSIYVLAGVVIGGAGSIIGPIIGTVIVLSANEYLSGFEHWQGAVFGGLLIVIAMGLPGGLAGAVRNLFVLWTARRARPLPTANDSPGDPAHPEMLLPEVVPDEVERAPETLRVRGAARSFGGVQAVNNVDLIVEPGTIHALVGTNGSGKTTLLNLICGYYSLDEGEVWLGKHRLDRLNVAAIAGLGVARTFQTPKLSLHDTALHNVQLGADLHSGASTLASTLHVPGARKRDAAARQRALDALAGVGLSANADVAAGGLSHGAQRLLEIARAVSMNPKLVLLDEPAAGLSVAEAEVLKDAVRAVARAGIGVLLIEHNLPVVFDLADHVTVLNQGEVICEGLPADVAKDPEVIRTYLGRSRPDPVAATVLMAEGADG